MKNYLIAEIPVRVRKYEVDTGELVGCLREYKKRGGLTNSEIASILDLPTTQVEHWFRSDQYFAIPDSDIWPRLRHLLRIETDEFDDAITQFIDKPGVFEQSQRLYLTEGIAPTIMAGQPQTVIVNDTNKTSN